MNLNPSPILCDGCGLPASPDHIAARIERLQWATRFRPIHIDVLFIALEPMARLQDDFYGPPEARQFFAPLLRSLNIVPDSGHEEGEGKGREADIARLVEFQRRGYYLTHVSECPLGAEQGMNDVGECISRLAPTLFKRIRFNYKPKHVAVLGNNLDRLIELFGEAGMSPLLDLSGAASLLPGPSWAGRSS